MALKSLRTRLHMIALGVSLLLIAIIYLSAYLATQQHIYLVTVLGLGFGLFVWAIVSFATSRVYANLQALRQFAKQTSQGDYSAKLDINSNSEFGELADNLVKSAEVSAQFFRRLNAVVEELDLVASHISSRAADLSRAAEGQFTSTEATEKQLLQMAAELRTVSDKVSSISDLSRASAQQSSKISVRNQHIGDKIQILSEGAESLSTSVNQFSANLANMATQIDVLRKASHNTEDAIVRTGEAMHRVREMSIDTSKISAEVSQQANIGAEQIENSMSSMQFLVDTMSQVRRATSGLETQIKRVVDLLDGINAVSKRTNLLSLNAAIIASQAGEHGHQFQVVAREVKALASQSTGLTNEIETVIAEIHRSGQKTSSAVDQASKGMQQGLELVRSTGEGLQSILAATHETASMSEEIAQAMSAREQDLTQVQKAMERVLGVTNKLQAGAQGQVSAVGNMQQVASNVSGVSDAFRDEAQRQISEMSSISQSLDAISTSVEVLLGIQNEQVNNSITITESMNSLREQAEKNNATAIQLEEASEVLVLQSTELRNETKVFIFDN